MLEYNPNFIIDCSLYRLNGSKEDLIIQTNTLEFFIEVGTIYPDVDGTTPMSEFRLIDIKRNFWDFIDEDIRWQLLDVYRVLWKNEDFKKYCLMYEEENK